MCQSTRFLGAPTLHDPFEQLHAYSLACRTERLGGHITFTLCKMRCFSIPVFADLTSDMSRASCPLSVVIPGGSRPLSPKRVRSGSVKAPPRFLQGSVRTNMPLGIPWGSMPMRRVVIQRRCCYLECREFSVNILQWCWRCGMFQQLAIESPRMALREQAHAPGEEG